MVDKHSGGPIEEDDQLFFLVLANAISFFKGVLKLGGWRGEVASLGNTVDRRFTPTLIGAQEEVNKGGL